MASANKTTPTNVLDVKILERCIASLDAADGDVRIAYRDVFELKWKAKRTSTGEYPCHYVKLNYIDENGKISPLKFVISGHERTCGSINPLDNDGLNRAIDLGYIKAESRGDASLIRKMAPKVRFQKYQGCKLDIDEKTGTLLSEPAPEFHSKLFALMEHIQAFYEDEVERLIQAGIEFRALVAGKEPISVKDYPEYCMILSNTGGLTKDAARAKIARDIIEKAAIVNANAQIHNPIQSEIGQKTKSDAQAGTPIANPLVRIGLPFIKKEGPTQGNLEDGVKFYDCASKYFEKLANGGTKPRYKLLRDPLTKELLNAKNVHLHLRPRCFLTGSIVDASDICFSSMGISLILKLIFGMVTPPPPLETTDDSDILDLGINMPECAPKVAEQIEDKNLFSSEENHEEAKDAINTIRTVMNGAASEEPLEEMLDNIEEAVGLLESANLGVNDGGGF